MKILVITSDQTRHRYFAQAVKRVFSGEVKTLAISKSKMHFTNRSAGLFADHQAQYNEMEKRVFALDHTEQVKGIDREVVKNEEATFYARVSGESMQGAGLDDGDLLVIDRSL